jgi:DNA-binding transcriptional regulator YhcF (GntR family)
VLLLETNISPNRAIFASTPTTITKALAELERRGLIVQTGRKIEIKDREGLLAIEEDETF